MLPDVGMAKHIHNVWKCEPLWFVSSHSHEGIPILTGEWKLTLGCTMSRNTHTYCWTFPWMVWHAAIHPWSSRQCTIPTSLRAFVENHFPPIVVLWGASWYTTKHHHPYYIDSTTVWSVVVKQPCLSHHILYVAICFCNQGFLQISQINKLTDNFIANIYIQIQCILLCITLLSHGGVSIECLHKLFKTWFRSCSPAIL